MCGPRPLPFRPDCDADIIRDAVRAPVGFAAIFDRHYLTVHRNLARRVVSQAADDLASETFTRALAAVALFDGDHPNARPWLLSIATTRPLPPP